MIVFEEVLATSQRIKGWNRPAASAIAPANVGLAGDETTTPGGVGPSPRGIAFLSEEGERERWTYGGLAEVAQRAAGAWRNLGVSPGDRVGLLGSTTPEPNRVMTPNDSS